MRLATFNVENFFARAKALRATAPGEANPALEAFGRFNPSQAGSATSRPTWRPCWKTSRRSRLHPGAGWFAIVRMWCRAHAGRMAPFDQDARPSPVLAQAFRWASLVLLVVGWSALGAGGLLSALRRLSFDGCGRPANLPGHGAFYGGLVAVPASAVAFGMAMWLRERRMWDHATQVVGAAVALCAGGLLAVGWIFHGELPAMRLRLPATTPGDTHRRHGGGKTGSRRRNDDRVPRRNDERGPAGGPACGTVRRQS